jgi:pyruvate formate lyase activating enzyme
VLLDIKSFDVTTHREPTGGELTPTLDFATRLDRLGKRTWIRCVLVPGWTDDPEAVDGLARFLAGLDSAERVDVLPFHKLGAAEYDALGIPFPLRDDPVPGHELIERVRKQFREHGRPLNAGGRLSRAAPRRRGTAPGAAPPAPPTRAPSPGGTGACGAR